MYDFLLARPEAGCTQRLHIAGKVYPPKSQQKWQSSVSWSCGSGSGAMYGVTAEKSTALFNIASATVATATPWDFAVALAVQRILNTTFGVMPELADSVPQCDCRCGQKLCRHIGMDSDSESVQGCSGFQFHLSSFGKLTGPGGPGRAEGR